MGCSKLTLKWLHQNILHKGCDSKIEGCIADKFSRCLGDEKLQNKYFKKIQKSWVAERCKTKKTSRKQKKNKKTNFPEVLEMEEVRQETQNIGFLVFPRFFDFSLRGPPQRVLEYWYYWLIHHLTLYFFGSHFLHCILHSLLYLYLNLEQLITIHSTIS